MSKNATNPELDPMLAAEQNQQQLQQEQQETVILQVEVSELNVIFAALQELPFRVVDPILKKIFEQAQRQLN
jgi:hypothetical protein